MPAAVVNNCKKGPLVADLQKSLASQGITCTGLKKADLISLEKGAKKHGGFEVDPDGLDEDHDEAIRLRLRLDLLANVCVLIGSTISNQAD